jgi:hypothetical protein
MVQMQRNRHQPVDRALLGRVLPVLPVAMPAGHAGTGAGPRIWGVAAGVVLSTGLVLARQVPHSTTASG